MYVKVINVTLLIILKFWLYVLSGRKKFTFVCSFTWLNYGVYMGRINKRKQPNSVTHTCLDTLYSWESQRPHVCERCGCRKLKWDICGIPSSGWGKMPRGFRGKECHLQDNKRSRCSVIRCFPCHNREASKKLFLVITLTGKAPNLNSLRER